MLEDLNLKPGSFEYLDLPFAVQEGRIGRLEIQVSPVEYYRAPSNILHHLLYPTARSSERILLEACSSWGENFSQGGIDWQTELWNNFAPFVFKAQCTTRIRSNS